MPPPPWVDEQGRPLPTYPCPRPGGGGPARFRGFKAEHLRHVGWRAYYVESYVNWCGHTQEVIPMPQRAGGVWRSRCSARQAERR